MNKGYFGKYGGTFIPETLSHACEELDQLYSEIKDTDEFKSELNDIYVNYVGRPSPLYFAESLTEYYGGPKIWFKREDLNHTGAHKINNTVGQALLAKKLGKKRIIAERLVAGSMMSGRRIEIGRRPGTAVQVFVGAAHRKIDPATIELNWVDSCTVTEIPNDESAEFLNLTGQVFHISEGSASIIHMIDQNRRYLFIKHFRNVGTISSFQQDFKIRTEAFHSFEHIKIAWEYTLSLHDALPI